MRITSAERAVTALGDTVPVLHEHPDTPAARITYVDMPGVVVPGRDTPPGRFDLGPLPRPPLLPRLRHVCALPLSSFCC